MDHNADLCFVAEFNARQCLLVGYCFDRKDFSWVTFWEGNRTISAVPWKSRTETRGLEFGTTPNPVPRPQAFRDGTIFGTPAFICVPARTRKTIRYVAFPANLPAGFRALQKITRAKDGLVLHDPYGKTVPIPTSAEWNP